MKIDSLEVVDWQKLVKRAIKGKETNIPPIQCHRYQYMQWRRHFIIGLTTDLIHKTVIDNWITKRKDNIAIQKKLNGKNKYEHSTTDVNTWKNQNNILVKYHLKLYLYIKLLRSHQRIDFIFYAVRKSHIFLNTFFCCEVYFNSRHIKIT